MFGKSRVFVSYSGAGEIGDLIRLLTGRGYEVTTALDAPAGVDWPSWLSAAVQAADLVIVVARDSTEQANAAFEVGLAMGQGKRPLVLTVEGLALPAAASELVVSTADLANEDAVLAAIEAAEYFGAGQTTRPSGQTVLSHPLGAIADDLLAQWKANSQSSRMEARDAERLVAAALQASGIQTLAAKPDASDAGFDFALWSRELEPFVGAPLLVEVIAGRSSPRRVSLHLRQLAEAVAHTPATWALAVASEPLPRGSATEAQTYGPVLTIGLDALLGELRTRSFVEIVRRLRNERVHA